MLCQFLLGLLFTVHTSVRISLADVHDCLLTCLNHLSFLLLANLQYDIRFSIHPSIIYRTSECVTYIVCVYGICRSFFYALILNVNTITFLSIADVSVHVSDPYNRNHLKVWIDGMTSEYWRFVLCLLSWPIHISGLIHSIFPTYVYSSGCTVAIVAMARLRLSTLETFICFI